MDENAKAQVKIAIVARMEALEKQIADLKEATKPMGLDNAVGRLSRMDYINNKAIDESNLRQSENKLQALKRWLEILDTDKFGKCSRCGNGINPKRLLFMPESTRCIHCAGK